MREERSRGSKANGPANGFSKAEQTQPDREKITEATTKLYLESVMSIVSIEAAESPARVAADLSLLDLLREIMHRVNGAATANPAERIKLFEVEQPAIQPQGTAKDLATLYAELLTAADREKRVSAKTTRDNIAWLQKFQEWASSQRPEYAASPVRVLMVAGILKEYAEHMRAKEKGNSASMCMKALAAIRKLAKACQHAGLITVLPDIVQRSAVNVLRPRTEKQRRVKAVPVTVDEVSAMLAVVDGCKWPRLGSVSPAVFWRACLISHFVYGFRSQDWFAGRSKEKRGLLWSGVVTESQCPLLDDLHNASGWAWYLVHKTKNKDEAAERPSDVLVPLSPGMRDLIEQFRGLDSDRVFPMANNSQSYSKEFQGILKRSGLSDADRDAVGKPMIRLSLGQRNVASFRKGCAAYWATHVGRSASSYLLHHSVAEDGVSKTTTDSYLQNESVLREITLQIGSFPW